MLEVLSQLVDISGLDGLAVVVVQASLHVEVFRGAVGTQSLAICSGEDIVRCLEVFESPAVVSIAWLDQIVAPSHANRNEE